MTKLEAGKNYVTVGGEETGPLRLIGEDGFVSDRIRAKNKHGETAGKQVWNSDGTVWDASKYEANDRIRLDFPKRWEAVITYALASGFVDVDLFNFEEFDELATHIEGGRDFHTVEEISIRLNPDHLASMFKKAD